MDPYFTAIPMNASSAPNNACFVIGNNLHELQESTLSSKTSSPFMVPFGFSLPPLCPSPPFPMPLASRWPPFGFQQENIKTAIESLPPSLCNPDTVGRMMYFTGQPYSPNEEYQFWQQLRDGAVTIMVRPAPPYVINQLMCADRNLFPLLQQDYGYSGPRISNHHEFILMPESVPSQESGEKKEGTALEQSVAAINHPVVSSVSTVERTAWKKSRGRAQTKPRTRHSSMPSSSANQNPPFCLFCKNNRETKTWYGSHVLKSRDGMTCCPILRKYVCPRCSATGDNAHTLQYCPENPESNLNRQGRSRSKSLTCDRSHDGGPEVVVNRFPPNSGS